MRCVILSLERYHEHGKKFIVKELGVCYPESGLSMSFWFHPSGHGHDCYIDGTLFRDSDKVGDFLKKLTGTRQVYVRSTKEWCFLATHDIISKRLWGCPETDDLPNVWVICNAKDHFTNTRCAERSACKYAIFWLSKIKK